MTGYCSRNFGNVWPQQIMCQLQNVGNVWHLYLCFWIPRNSFVKLAARTSASLSNMCNESKIKQHRSMYAVSLGIDRMRHAHWYCTCSRVPSWRYSSTFLKRLTFKDPPFRKVIIGHLCSMLNLLTNQSTQHQDALKGSDHQVRTWLAIYSPCCPKFRGFL